MVYIEQAPYELYHHGVKGQKWGIRRYQNPDGTLTEEGKRRYAREVSETLAKGLQSRSRSNKISEEVSGLSKQVLSKDQIKRLQQASWQKQKLSDKWDQLQEDAIEYANNAKGVIDKDGYFDDDVWMKAANSFLDRHGNDKLVDDMDRAQEKYMKECENIAKELLGESGSRSTVEFKSGGINYQFPIKNLVSEALSEMQYRKRGDEWVVY